MPPISSSLRLIIWITTGTASFIFAILVIVLDKNIRYALQKKGRPPGVKSPLLWFLFWLAAITIILGTATASSAPEANFSSGNFINADSVTTMLSPNNTPIGTLSSNYPLFDDFNQNCINLKYWQPFAYLFAPDIFSSNVSANPILTKQTDGCLLSAPDFNWGFEANNGSLIIKNKLREGQISTFYAISAPITQNSVFSFELLVSELEGNLVIGIQPDATSLLMDWDTTKAYLDISADQKLTLRRGFVTNIGKQTFAKGIAHQIKIVVLPDYVLVDVDKWEETISIDGDFESPYLVIGYVVSGGGTIDATFNNLLLGSK